MSSANRFLLTFLGRPQAHVLHAQACAAQEDDSPDSSSRRLTNARCKAAGGGGCDLCIPAGFSGVWRLGSNMFDPYAGHVRFSSDEPCMSGCLWGGL